MKSTKQLKPVSSNENFYQNEIDRLNKLILYYETTNLDQRNQIDYYTNLSEATSKRILDQEKAIKSLTNKIKSLEENMKYDKIASDGIRKKFNLIEYDVKEFKHSNEMMQIERNEHIHRIHELEIDLNSNRIDKLKLMHENAILKKNNQSLADSESFARNDCLIARQELLDKLQNLDNALNENESLKRLTYAQNEEMINLSHEVYDVQETYTNVNNQVVNMELISSEHNKTIDILQHEISRLRKELMFSSINNNTHSHTNAYGIPSRVNRVATAITNSAYTDLNGPYANTRRPMTEHGVSRDRNRNNSISTILDACSKSNHNTTTSISIDSNSRSVKHAVITLPHMSTLSSPHKYHYNDLNEKVQKDLLENEIGSKAIPVGATQQSIRTDMLKSYDDLLSPNNNLKSPSLHANHPHDNYSGTISNTTSLVCSPVSTPHRRLHHIEQQQQRPSITNNAGTVGITHQVASQINTKHSSTGVVKESLKNIKKCYSMPSMKKGKLNKLTIDTTDMMMTRSVSTAPTLLNHINDQQDLHDKVADELSNDALKYIQNDEGSESISYNDNNNSTANHIMINDTTSAYSEFDPLPRKYRKSNKPHNRTIYIGTGLGLRHNEELDNKIKNLNKGSTTQILKKILDDKFN